MNYSLHDEIAVIRGEHSLFHAAKANARFPLCIESQSGEIYLGVDPTDLIVVSAPEGGPLEPGLMMIEMVRAYHTPLLVLPREHPGSRRISYVVSVGPVIHASCSIQRGTHPEQNVICSHAELAGITLNWTGDGFSAGPLPEGISIRLLKYRISTEFC